MTSGTFTAQVVGFTLKDKFSGEVAMGTDHVGDRVYLTPQVDGLWRIRGAMQGWLFRGSFPKERAELFARCYLGMFPYRPNPR